MVQERHSYSTQSTARPKKTQYWRWLLPPMLLASLGLHGLFLFVPMGASDEDLVPPPDPEEDGIAVTKIDAPQPRRPVASTPANAGTVKTSPPAEIAAPTQSAQPAPTRPQAQTSRPSNSTTRRPQGGESTRTGA